MNKRLLRKRLRIKFIELNKDEILKAIAEREQRKGVKLSEAEKEIADKMRKRIGYSPKTNNWDIVFPLLLLGKNVLISGKKEVT